MLIIRQQAAGPVPLAKRAVNEAGGQLQAFDIGSLFQSPCAVCPVFRLNEQPGATMKEQRPTKVANRKVANSLLAALSGKNYQRLLPVSSRSC